LPGWSEAQSGMLQQGTLVPDFAALLPGYALPVIASAAKQSRLPPRKTFLDCFAAFAMTVERQPKPSSVIPAKSREIRLPCHASFCTLRAKETNA